MDDRNNIAYECQTEERSSNEMELHPVNDLMCYLRQYTRERPEVVALTCFGVGFILGWKLKPW
jgi:hypothetical protein